MPSLLFIVGAYALFALCILWSRHQRNRYRYTSRRYGPRTPRLLLGGSLLAFVCIIGLVVSFLTPPPHNPVNLNCVLKAAGPGWIVVKTELLPEELRLLHKGDGYQPVYALLHPETPPIMMPEKPAPPRGSRRVRPKRPSPADLKKIIVSSQPSAHGQAASKSRVKQATVTTAVKASLVPHVYTR